MHTVWQTIEKSDEHEVDATTRKKSDVFKKMITKHEQKVVKSGLNIIPARGEKFK